MNVLQSSDRRTRGYKENSILSFNSAAKFPIDFIEFDVQVGSPIYSLSQLVFIFLKSFVFWGFWFSFGVKKDSDMNLFFFFFFKMLYIFFLEMI